MTRHELVEEQWNNRKLPELMQEYGVKQWEMFTISSRSDGGDNSDSTGRGDGK